MVYMIIFNNVKVYRYEEHGGMQTLMFSILTREAAGTVKDIHDRILLILDKEDVKGMDTP